jgi:hypothetical protein
MSEVTIVVTGVPANEPLDGALLRVYSGSTLVTTGVTGEGANAAGSRVFTLSDGTYSLRVAMPSPGYVVGSPRSLVVAGDGTYDVFVEQPDLPVAANPAMCRCSGYALDGSAAPVRGVSFTLQLVEGPLILGDATLVLVPSIVVTDARGYLQVDLIRGALYRVEYGADSAFTGFFRVPDLSAAKFADVVHPVVAAVTFSPSSLALAVDEIGESAVTVWHRSGLSVALGSSELAVSFLSDPDGLSVSTSADGAALCVSASAAGTYTVTAMRVAVDGEIPVLQQAGVVTGSLTVTVS